MYPIFFKFGPITIRFYGLMIAIAFLVATYLMRSEAKRKGLGSECIVDFASIAIISGILGARLYYVILHIDCFLGHPADIIKIWQGGLAFHGGILGGFLAGIWFAKSRGIPFWKFADTGAPAIILAQVIGRTGCLLNGCCFGKETSLPWAVTFKNPESMALLNVPLHPTQLYEILGNLSFFLLLWKLRTKKMPDGYLFLLYAIMYSALRSALEFFRADAMYLWNTWLSWGQIMAITTIAFSVICIYKLRRKTKKGLPDSGL